MAGGLKIDIVSHYFPPIGGPGSTRMAGWARYLTEAGCSVRAVVPEPQAGDPYFQEGLAPPPGVEVVPVPNLDLSAPFRRSGGAVPPPIHSPASVRPGPGRRAVLAVRDLLELPDHRRVWNPRARATLMRLDPPADVVITTSPYPSTHLIGLEAKSRRPDTCWVADFRDVWSQHWGSRLHTPLHRWYNRRLLRRILQRADLVTCFHRVGVERLAATAGYDFAEKAQVVYNGVDPDHLDHFAARPFDPAQTPFRLVYAGTAWNWNIPPGFLAAWDRFRRAADREVRLDLYGRVDPEVVAAIAAHRGRTGDDTIALHGLIGPDRVRKVLAGAGALVIFAGPYPENVSSKLFESMATGRPILYLGNPASAGAGFLRQAGAADAVAPGFDAAGTEAAFDRLARALEGGDYTGLIPHDLPDAIDRRSQTLRLLAALEQRCGLPRTGRGAS